MRLFSLLFVILCIPTLLLAQDLVIKPYGVSPAAVIADTVGDPSYLGIRDRNFSGLKNVGVGTKVFLIGTFEDSSLTGLIWNMYELPGGSVAVLSEATEVDSASEVVSFIADITGTYRISISEGTFGDTVVINATTYRGVKGTTPNCSHCHANTFEEWQQTGHSSFLDNALDGLGRSGPTCLPCHTTGWDTFAVNDGFDDFDFVYPDTQFVGVADSMYTKYPTAMDRANIQCESCHGPGDAHIRASARERLADSRMIISIGPEACAYCHDDDHYHVYPSQWETAGHSHPPAYPGGTRDDCRGCHNGYQFIQYVENETITRQPYAGITCAVCHDPHNATNEYQMRSVEATLSNDKVVTQGGTGKLCMNCHQSRRDAVTYTTGPKTHLVRIYRHHHT
jgi:hypothetical protein